MNFILYNKSTNFEL